MSIFDHADEVPPPATWRCPHCSTQQPESSRCWACSRSPMTCSTCLYYRRAVVSGMGFCGLDRSRSPLTGEEVRTCWQASDEVRALIPDLAAHGVAPVRPEDRPALPLPARSTPAAQPRPGARLPTSPPPRAVAPGAAEAPARSPAGSVQDLAADGLIDAPSVPPGRRLASEAARRARRTREGEDSGDHDLH